MKTKHKQLLDQISELANDVPLHLLKSLAADIEQIAVDNWPYARNRVAQSMPQPNLRLQVGQLLDAWRQQSPELAPQSVALALLAAAQAAEQHRRAQSTSLVWTGPTGHGPALRRTDQALLQVINAAQERLLVVSFAVYKIPEIRQALLKAARRGVSLKICLEAPDPSEGKITYDALQALGKRVAQNAAAYIWPKNKRPRDDKDKFGSLHAKTAVADKDLLFISSANLTEYALKLNMELGVLIKGGPLPGNVVAHFNRLIEDGVLELVKSDVRRK